MAGLTEFYCGLNEPSQASQFKWLEYTFNWDSSLSYSDGYNGEVHCKIVHFPLRSHVNLQKYAEKYTTTNYFLMFCSILQVT
jgi:hypothetical protein